MTEGCDKPGPSSPDCARPARASTMYDRTTAHNGRQRPGLRPKAEAYRNMPVIDRSWSSRGRTWKTSPHIGSGGVRCRRAVEMTNPKQAIGPRGCPAGRSSGSSHSGSQQPPPTPMRTDPVPSPYDIEQGPDEARGRASDRRSFTRPGASANDITEAAAPDLVDGDQRTAQQSTPQHQHAPRRRDWLGWESRLRCAQPSEGGRSLRGRIDRRRWLTQQ